MTQARKPGKPGFVLGRDAFARISAIEGIVPSPEMEKLFRDFDRRGVPAEERRRALVQKYGRA